MSHQQREQMRLSILRYCEAAARYGLTDALLLQFIRSEGLRSVTHRQLEDEMVYLVDKALLAPMEKLISPENQAWRITALGRDFLATNGLEIGG